MMELVSAGKILMRHLLYYTDCENAAQGDPDEGLESRYTDENPTLKVVFDIQGKKLPMEVQSLRVASSSRRHGVTASTACTGLRSRVHPKAS